MATGIYLKRGSTGDILKRQAPEGPCIVRDVRTARPGCRWLARRLLRREAKALTRLAGLDGVPALRRIERDRLVRSLLAGRPLHEARPASADYYRDALRVLRRIHRAGVVHNDLAKEANWICRDGTVAGIVDFELAVCFGRRNRIFRRLAREDLRHLLKHKAQYRPDALTARQRAMLATPSAPARAWRRLFKPVYHALTRGLLRWPEREGAAERERPPARQGRGN